MHAAMRVRRAAVLLVLAVALGRSVAAEAQGGDPCVEFLAASTGLASLLETAKPFAGEPPHSLRTEIRQARRRLVVARDSATAAIEDSLARWVLSKAGEVFRSSVALNRAVGDWEETAGTGALKVLEASNLKVAEAAGRVFDEALRAACVVRKAQ